MSSLRSLGIALAGALLGLLVLFVFLRPRAPELPRLGSAPAFHLTSQAGIPFGGETLRGRVWLAGFFFTRCHGICPLLTQRMQEVGRRLPAGDAWRLVSFSVDPEHDLPAVLAAYADSLGADPAHWTFLTGTREDMHRVVVDGFHLAVEAAPPGAPEPIVHTPKIALVDRSGEIRGYYDALDGEGADHLAKDARRLLSAG